MCAVVRNYVRRSVNALRNRFTMRSTKSPRITQGTRVIGAGAKVGAGAVLTETMPRKTMSVSRKDLRDFDIRLSRAQRHADKTLAELKDMVRK